ncbi:TIGR00341 family protein [Gaopeijia maritima]|uniref:TIGR00341 family protein n=1 Tax=Gaopeijia maritima TaxID=3119007 RepID=UPI003249047C
MALRLVEIRVDKDHFDRLAPILDDGHVVDHWPVGATDGFATHRALVRTESVEALTDALADRFEADDGFRVVLLSVEATLPKVEEADKKDDEAGDDEPDRGWGRVSREELLQELETAARVDPVYLAGVALSTVVAAVGLIRGDVAVIIGAMVIAPLLGPNVALSLAVTLGDLDFGRRALVAAASGALVALGLSVLVGWFFPVDPTVAELAARTNVGLSDVALALAAGSAGALAFTSGLPTTVIGVMVAVALLPPLVATGLLAGQGLTTDALAAATLVATNVTCVNLAGVATFLVRRVGPRDWWEAERARRASRIAIGLWVALLLALVALILFAWSDPPTG